MKTATLIRRGTLALGFALLLPLAAHGQGSPNIIWQGTTNSDRINAISFTPDGSKVVSGSSDRLLVVWNASNGQVLNVMDQSAPYVHSSSIECLAVNPANPVQVATVSSNAEHLWNISTSARTDLSPEPETVDDWMVWCAFSHDGKYLATASFNETIRLWTVSGSSATLTKVFTTNALQRTCAFSPDGKWLASAGGDRSVTIRDTSTWDVVAVMTGHTNDIYDMQFSPDSTMLATGSYDDTARIWNVGAWTKKYVLPGSGPVYGVAFTADSKTLAYTDGEGNHLLIANLATGAITQTYDVNDVQCVAFSPQGTLAYGDVGETVYVANVGAPGSDSVNITSPTQGESFTAPANITLTATAFSSNGIANVQYFAENGTNLGAATTSPYSVSWNNLAAGSYSVYAVATDKSSRTATSETVNFTVGSGGSGPADLTLITNGLGAITPRIKTPVVGHKYTETANPGPKYVFDGWTDQNGNLLSSNASYTFTMATGLVLQANFVPNPFTPIQGRYAGLIDSSPATAEGKGRINLNLMPNGTFTASLNFDFTSLSLSGKFLGDGYFARTIPHGKDSSIALTLWLDVSNGTETLTGTISTSSVTSSILANRLVWNSRTNRATAGHYTVTILPDSNETNSPQGFGYAHVVIDAAGGVTANGHLADGQAFSETTFLSESNAWPFFVWGGGADIASGFITVESETNTDSDMDGVVTWFRQANDHATYYPSGFDSTNEFLGSLDPAGNVVLTTGATDTNGDNATVTISGADFSTPLTFSGLLTHSKLVPDKSTGSPKGFNMTFADNGIMQGTFVDPQSGRTASFQGIVYQDGNYAAGYFLQDGQSGSIEVMPSP